MFLWHYPHGCPHWALPSKSGLWGARTFLRLKESATACASSSLASSLLSLRSLRIPGHLTNPGNIGNGEIAVYKAPHVFFGALDDVGDLQR